MTSDQNLLLRQLPTACSAWCVKGKALHFQLWRGGGLFHGYSDLSKTACWSPYLQCNWPPGEQMNFSFHHFESVMHN